MVFTHFSQIVYCLLQDYSIISGGTFLMFSITLKKIIIRALFASSMVGMSNPNRHNTHYK